MLREPTNRCWHGIISSSFIADSFERNWGGTTWLKNCQATLDHTIASGTPNLVPCRSRLQALGYRPVCKDYNLNYSPECGLRKLPCRYNLVLVLITSSNKFLRCFLRFGMFQNTLISLFLSISNWPLYVWCPLEFLPLKGCYCWPDGHHLWLVNQPWRTL